MNGARIKPPHLPAYSGEGSYINLLQLYSNRSGGATELSQGDTVLLLPPLSFLRSGHYSFTSGSLAARDSYGYYWSSSFYSRLLSYLLDFGPTRLRLQVGYDRGYAFPVRCLARLNGARMLPPHLPHHCKLILAFFQDSR